MKELQAVKTWITIWEVAQVARAELRLVEPDSTMIELEQGYEYRLQQPHRFLIYHQPHQQLRQLQVQVQRQQQQALAAQLVFRNLKQIPWYRQKLY